MLCLRGLLGCLLLACMHFACGEAFVPSQQDTPDILRWQSTLHLLHESHAVMPVAHGHLLPQYGTSVYKSLPTAIGRTCSQVTISPTHLSAQQLPEQYQVDWLFEQCGQHISGQRHIEVIQTKMHASLDLMQQSALSHSFLNGAKRRFESKSQATLQFSPYNVWQDWQWQEQGEHQFQDVDEQLMYHDVYELQWRVQDTFDQSTGEVTERLVHGTGYFESLFHQESVEVAFSQLLYEPSVCCYPLAGTLTHRSKQQPLLQGHFTTTCRMMHWKNGQVRWLPPCPGDENIRPVPL